MSSRSHSIPLSQCIRVYTVVLYVHFKHRLHCPQLLMARFSTRRSTWGKSTDPITLCVYNKCSSSIEAFWVDYKGDMKQSYGSAAPGKMLPLSSFSTHVWCLKIADKPDQNIYYKGPSAVLNVLQDGTLEVNQLQEEQEGDESWWHPSWGRYKQRGEVMGLHIMAFDCVCDDAVSALSCCISHMLATCRPDIRARLVGSGCKLAIIGTHQATTDIPAHRFMRHQVDEGGRDINATTRGLGATAAVPTASCGEENLTMSDEKRYPAESIAVHEFAHAVMNLGFSQLDTAAIQRLFKQAQQQHIYQPDCYMMENADEYWAEASQAWFGATLRTDVNSGIYTRRLLQQQDPGLAELLIKVYGSNTWQYTDTCPGTFQARKQHNSCKRSRQKQHQLDAGLGRYNLRPRQPQGQQQQERQQQQQRQEQQQWQQGLSKRKKK